MPAIPTTMRRTVDLALRAGVAIGAHVSLPDLQGFGRREMKISADETYALTLYQIGALAGFARAAGARLTHVKPHGALYTMAARDAALADAIAQAVQRFDASLRLVGLAASELPRAGERAGLAGRARSVRRPPLRKRWRTDPRAASTTRSSRTSTTRSRKRSPFARGDGATTRQGRRLALHADTICVHGDRANAAQFAQRLREGLCAAGIAIAALPPRIAASSDEALSQRNADR